MGCGVARPRGGDQAPFAAPPVPGDALYLGFGESLGRLVVGVTVECSQARGAGVDPEDPPLRWEYSTGEGALGWREATVLADHTGGFNYGSGLVELELPEATGTATVGDHKAHWIRCRVDPYTRSEVEAAYTLPPEIYSITAGAMGARIPAMHATRRRAEMLGESDGTSGQTFRVRYAPVLPTGPDETLEVLAPRAADWERWELRQSFAESGPDDPHAVLDGATGELHLGPAVNAGDGTWQQYGRVPAKGALLRMSGYRTGGGRQGNVAAGTLTVLKSSIPGVAGRSPTRWRPPAAWTPRRWTTPACERRWSCAAATGRSPWRTSRRWPPRPRGRWRACTASRPTPTTAWCGCASCPWSRTRRAGWSCTS